MFMAVWVREFIKHGLDYVLEFLDAYLGIIPLSDLLHLGKNFRTRFLEHLLIFMFSWVNVKIDLERVRGILTLKAPLLDLSPLGKMRDAYPLVLMRVENIVTLIENDAIAEAVALLPMALCFDAVRLETIPRETRFDLLQIAFFLVCALYELRELGIDTNPEKPAKGSPASIFTSQWTVRFLDTSLSLMLCVKKYIKLALDRVSTHPEENFFGYVRWDSGDINTSGQMLRTISQTDIVKEAERSLGVEENVRKRTNLAGVHYDDENPNTKILDIRLSVGLNPEAIAGICLDIVGVASPSEGHYTSEWVQVSFLRIVEYFKMIVRAERASQTSSEKDQHFICGSGSRIISGFAAHRPPVSQGNP
jgi:hypothetical protein